MSAKDTGKGKPSPSESSWMMGGDLLDAASFLGAITIEGDHSKARALLNSAFNDTGQPSPRAKELVESGGWEVTEVVLYLVEEESVDLLCGARISLVKGEEICVCWRTSAERGL
jgi:hypothetical protein